MAFILALLAVGLGIAARRTNEKYLRNFLIVCCLTNAIGAFHMMATGYEGAYRLMPQSAPEPGDQYEDARPDRR